MEITTTKSIRSNPCEVARLVAGAASGDQTAWDALVRAFAGMVWSVARAHRLNEADAADVAQATWLRLFEHLDRVNDPARVGAWLATTARRESLRVLRNARRHMLSADPVADDHQPTDAPADADILLAERDRSLLRALDRLAPRDRALLRMVVADGDSSYVEISAALDMPIGSIGPTRARALERLRRELERDGATALLAA